MPFKNPEDKKANDKKYRLANLERIREYDRKRTPERYWNNPKANRAKRKRYYYKHQELELSRKKISDERERLHFEESFRFDARYRHRLWYSAKKRASLANVPFDISPDDIVIPEFCPVLGIKLSVNRNRGFKPSSPSVDRRIPNLGYVKTNIRVISYRANELKRDASLDELKKLVAYLEE